MHGGSGVGAGGGRSADTLNSDDEDDGVDVFRRSGGVKWSRTDWFVYSKQFGKC